MISSILKSEPVDVASLEGLAADPYSYARLAKEQGQKVIAVTPMNFPEELVHASGALPIVLQESKEAITTGWSYMFPQFCGFSRSNVDAAAKGHLNFFDALIISDMCVQTRTAFNVALRHADPRLIYVWWPPDYDSQRWMPSVVARLERCKKELEDVVGTTFGESELRDSIDLFNRHRRLLRELSSLRQVNPHLFSARQFQLLVQSSMLLPKEEHVRLLEGVLANADHPPDVAETKPRILVSGHMCHAVRGEILDLIEEAGAVVVADDLYTGSRYAAANLPTDVPPMEALALRFLAPGVPCPTKCGPQGDWAAHLLSSVAASGAQGVISFIPKHCEPHMFYYPYVKDQFEAAGIPFVLIETEHESVSIEGTKTRIQAVVETLAGWRR